MHLDRHCSCSYFKIKITKNTCVLQFLLRGLSDILLISLRAGYTETNDHQDLGEKRTIVVLLWLSFGTALQMDLMKSLTLLKSGFRPPTLTVNVYPSPYLCKRNFKASMKNIIQRQWTNGSCYYYYSHLFLRCCGLPIHLNWPLTMIASLVQRASHSSMLCDVRTMHLPPFTASAILPHRNLLAIGSIPAVGSS